MKPLRSLLIGGLAFLVLNALVTAAVTFSPLNKKFNFSYGNFLPTKLEMLKAQPPVDILFLGTSQTNNGFSTQTFEQAAPKAVTTFNMGLPNNRYDVMLSYLKLHVRKFGKPKVLLLELSPTIQEKGTRHYYLPALYFRSIIENDPVMATDIFQDAQVPESVKQELLLASFSSLYQYRHTFSPVNLLGKVTGKAGAIAAKVPVIGSAFAAEVPSEPAAEEVQIPEAVLNQTAHLPQDMMTKGWFPKDGTAVMQTPAGQKKSAVEARKYFLDSLEAINFEKLDTLLDYCKQEQIPVVLVSWPNHPAYNAEFEKSRHAQPYRRGLKTLFKKHSLPWISLEEQAVRSPNQLFADPRHLTAEGAQLYTEALAEAVLTLPNVAPALNK